jgi:hypothetical protein
VGALKLVCPNVRRYKLLMLNYLQMFGSFRQPKQMYNRISNVQLLPSAPTCHNTMLCAVFLSSDNASSGEKLSKKGRPKMSKNCPTKRQIKFSKVARCRKKLSNEATKLILKSPPKLQKNCPTKQQNKLNSGAKVYGYFSSYNRNFFPNKQ